MYDYDLFVIGAGSGGVRGARMAAQAGARVAIAEDTHMGGTCVNVGCVPKKLMVYASRFSDEFEDSKGFGWSEGEHRFNWKAFRKKKDKEIERLNGIYDGLLERSGVEVLRGTARLVDGHTIGCGEKQVTAERILIAAGGKPYVPEFEGAKHVVTSNALFFLDELPKHITIVGGGYIAVEFAGIFHRLGVGVTQLYRGELFLRGFDEEIRRALGEQMVKDGIDLRFGVDVEKIEKAGGGYVVVTGEGEEFETGLVCYATGRVPRTEGIGLEAVGVEMKGRGVIAVDEYSRTSVDHIYAVGDCTDRANLTPVAIEEAMAFVKTVYGGEATTLDYNLIPSCVFSQPNIGTVGLTEEQARAQYPELLLYRSRFRPMKNTISGREEQMIMKLLVDGATDKVVGCHILGMDAGEIIQGIAIAMNCGATKADFDRTMAIHPTAAEELVTMREPVV